MGEAAALFVPGNHDWGNGGAERYAAILRQETLIEPVGEREEVVAQLPLRRRHR